MDNYQLQHQPYTVRKLWRRLAWVVLAAVFVLGDLWLAAKTTGHDFSLGADAAKGVSAEAAGANGYGFATNLTGLAPAQLNQRLSDMQATGATWVRFDLPWDEIQSKGPNNYDWSSTDTIVKAAAAHHMKVVLDIDFVPTWARERGCTNSKMCGPADPGTYGKFAAAAARHYQPYGVEDYEIWNEPNISFRFHPAADPQLYVNMLKSAYNGIKQVDPSATVIAASTAPSATDAKDYNPADFLSAMYSDGAAGYFDAISAHPYTYPLTPAQSAPTDAWGQLTTMYNDMEAHGDGNKQIWITEFGAPTDGPNQPRDHVSEAVQAQIATQAISIFHSYSWSGPLFWYDYQDAGTGTLDSENFYGLVRADGTFKPAYYAFVKAVAANK